MKAKALLALVQNALEDLKGQDIRVLDVEALTSITSHMVVCSGTSVRHVKSMAENVVAEAKHKGHQPLGVEGQESGEWVLVDLGDVVVHVMHLQTRALYQLEKLWDVRQLADAEIAAKHLTIPEPDAE